MPFTLDLSLLPIPDPQIVEAIDSILDRLPIEGASFQWRTLNNENNTAPRDQLRNDETFRSVMEERGEVLVQVGASFRGTNITPPNQANGSFRVDRQTDGLLTVRVELPDGWSTPTRTQAAIVIRQALARYARSKVVDAIAPQIADFYTRRESTLVQLEALNATITVQNDQHRRALEQRTEELRQRLEEAHQERLTALETEFRLKTDELSKREAAVDERKKLLDDRDNTHARRQIQQDVRSVLSERIKDFSLTKKTIRKRMPSGVALVALMIALLTASGWALWATTQALATGVPYWYPLLRFALSLGAFGSSVVFFIHWQDRWSDAHAAEEFRLKRFDLDIARASWLVEVVLEGNTTKSQFPQDLIQALSNGLFQQTPAESGVKHPAEEILGALLSSSTLNLKLPGGNMTLDPKGVKEVMRKTD